MPEFQEGITSLERMNEELDALIQEHNTWQDADSDLRVLTDVLEESMAAFNKPWQRLKAKTAPLYRGKTDNGQSISKKWMHAWKKPSRSLMLRSPSGHSATLGPGIGSVLRC